MARRHSGLREIRHRDRRTSVVAANMTVLPAFEGDGADGGLCCRPLAHLEATPGAALAYPLCAFSCFGAA